MHLIIPRSFLTAVILLITTVQIGFAQSRTNLTASETQELIVSFQDWSEKQNRKTEDRLKKALDVAVSRNATADTVFAFNVLLEQQVADEDWRALQSYSAKFIKHLEPVKSAVPSVYHNAQNYLLFADITIRGNTTQSDLEKSWGYLSALRELGAPDSTSEDLNRTYYRSLTMYLSISGGLDNGVTDEFLKSIDSDGPYFGRQFEDPFFHQDKCSLTADWKNEPKPSISPVTSVDLMGGRPRSNTLSWLIMYQINIENGEAVSTEVLGMSPYISGVEAAYADKFVGSRFLLESGSETECKLDGVINRTYPLRAVIRANR